MVVKYMEVPFALGSGDAICSDDSCPCGYPGATIPRGGGYFYISKEVVDFRKDCPTVLEAEAKVRRMVGPRTLFVAGSGVLSPILVCEIGAKKRGLNLEVAAADARHWWQTGLVPLRPTPLAGEPDDLVLTGRSEMTKGPSYVLAPSTEMAHGGRDALPPESAEEVESFRFHCSSCAKRLKAHPKLVGKKVKCPKCGVLVTIPQRDSSATFDDRQPRLSTDDKIGRHDYQRVLRACEASKEAALLAARAAGAPTQDQEKAGRLCQKIWGEALADLSGRSLDLSGVDLSDMAFVWCGKPGFSKASFRGAQLDRTIWFFVGVDGADFTGASLRECRTWGFFCDGASFRKADLSGGFLAICPLSDPGKPVDFSGANLRGATLSLIGGERMILTNARMEGCKFLIGPGATRQQRKALLAGLTDEQRQVVKMKKKWWEFWK